MVILFVLLAAFGVQAGTHTWTGGSTSGLWSTAANWENNDPPALGETPLHLVFPTNAPRRFATNNFGGLVVSSITFHGAPYTLAGIGAGTNLTVDSSEGHLWWNVRAFSGAGHTFHYSLNLLLDGNLEFNISTNANVIVRSRLSAATPNSGLLKDGPGSVYLDPVEANTFDGTTRIVDGTLRLEGSHIGFGGFTVTDVTVPGPLIIGDNSSVPQPRCLLWQANQIADTSAVTVNRNGQLLFADVNDTIGSLTMAGGIVDTANGKLTLNGNVIIQNPPSGTPSQFLGYLDLGSIGRFFTVETNAYFDVSAVISGGNFGNVPAGVNKLGPGWMAFTSPSNTFGGDLYISAGIVSITNGKQIGAPTNAASVANGGTLALSGIGFGPIVTNKELNLQTGARLLALLNSEWNGPVQLYGQAIIEVPVNKLLSIGGVVSGVGGITKVGEGELRFTGSVANTFTGGLAVERGEVLLAKNSGVISVPGPLTIGSTNNGGTIGKVILGNNNQIANDAMITIYPFSKLDSADFSDVIGDLHLYAGHVTSTGTGLWTLNGQVYSHYVNLFAAFGTFSGKVSLGFVQRTFHCDQYAFLLVEAPLIGSGGGGVLKTGPGALTFYTTNTYPGLTRVEEGILSLALEGQPGSTAAGTEIGMNGSLWLTDATVIGEHLTLDGNGTNAFSVMSLQTNVWQGGVTLIGGPNIHSYTNDSLLTFSGSLQGTSGIGFDGPGTIVYSGAGDNTYQGNTVVKEGKLMLNKLNAAAIQGNLVIGYPTNGNYDGTIGKVVLGNNNQIANDAIITIYPFSKLDSANFSDVIGDLHLYAGHVTSTGTGLWTLNGQVYSHYVNLFAAFGTFSGKVSLGFVQRTLHCDQYAFLLVDAPLIGSGGGGILKTGPGALTFYTTNTYPGLTRVEEGILSLALEGQPGSTAAGTEVGPNGSLWLTDVTVIGEHLTLDGNGTNAFSVMSLQTNVWQGGVTLIGGPNIRSYTNDSLLTFSGSLQGTSGVGFDGPGTIVYSGAGDNTYQGNTVVKGGKLMLDKLNAAAIPGNLVIGYPTNAPPSASVFCKKSSQFAPVTLATLPSRLVTINPFGGLHLEDSQQFIANITMQGGNVTTGDGLIYLHRNFTVLANLGGGGSAFYGNLGLASPLADNTHLLNVETNGSLLFWGQISQGSFQAHLQKLGAGELAMICSNSFDGLFLISNGRVLASGAQPFGTLNGSTIVHPGATLGVFSGVYAEPFSLEGTGYTNQGALVSYGTNVFTGTISLAADATVAVPASTNLSVVTGLINGPGGLTKIGQGTLRLAGSTDNTFSGTTRVQQGALELNKTNATAIVAPLEIAVGGGDGLVRYLRGAQLGDLTPVTIGANGQLRLLGHTDTIGSLAGQGIVELLAGTLATGNDPTPTTYAGVISGIGGNLMKVGSGVFTLTGDNAYTGATFVKGGTLVVNGVQPQSNVSIQTGGSLAGNGTVGAIGDLAGHVKPGAPTYGALKCGDLTTLAPMNQFQFDINGTTPGVNCDQLDVSGSVSLTAGILQVAMNFPGAVSNQYMIVKNDGVDAVIGNFAGLPQDAMLTNNGVVFKISYHGGDGNDIVLIQQNAGNPAQISGAQMLGNGTLQINATGFPNTTYTVEAAESLNPPIDWQAIGTVNSDNAGLMQFIDADAPHYQMRFYRFRLP